VTLEADVAGIVPWNAFVALIEHHVLPFSGGVLDQPYNLWEAISLMAQGYRKEVEYQAEQKRRWEASQYR
jgi:hypothetical protein